MTSPGLHLAEPPAQYLHRAPLVVDCSVLVGAAFQEHWRDAAQRQIADRTLHAPDLLQVEFSSVVLKKTRQGLGALADAALQAMEQLSIELHRIEEREVVALAARYQLTAYDACYLWLAADLRVPLATFDDRLAAAARVHLANLS